MYTKAGIGLFIGFALLVIAPSLIAISTHKGSAPNVEAWSRTSDAQVKIAVYRVAENQTVHMTLADYLTNVIAAEVGPDASMAAMEAAAVAARTYVIGAMAESTTLKPVSTVAKQHGALVTDSGTLDLPFLTVAGQSQKFGQATDAMTARIQGAIEATDGEILTYHGQPILAFTTQVSAGATRTPKFDRTLPYMTSVNCPDDDSAPGFTRSYTFTQSTLQHLLGWSPQNVLQTHVTSTDQSGYVLTVNCGKKAMTGDAFATKLGLASVNFTLSVDAASQLVVTTKGIGSGYGMSLNEANHLAMAGWTQSKILTHFYPSTKLARDASWL